MKIEDLISGHDEPIRALWEATADHHGVTYREFAERLAAIFTRNHRGSEESTGEATSFLSTVRSAELCLAIACEKGDEAAWRRFETEYRHSMQGAARSLTRDEAEAEDLIQFVFGELYGIRMDGDRRLSKLAHYSGRGSLGGWLRAVIYQAFIDRKRQTSRFEQVEEVEDFDRLVNASAAQFNGALSAPLVQPDEIDDVRLRRATEQAIGQAFEQADSRDRLLLNYYYFDDLTLREIGVLMGVHEATISRWLARAQRDVKRRTEEILQRSFGMRRAEIAECLQIAARSELDVRKLVGNVKGHL